MQVFIHQASLQTSSHPQQWETHGEDQRRRGSQAISELCHLEQMHSTLYSPFYPPVCPGVNNSGRFSIILILSSKWLALKILKRKQSVGFVEKRTHLRVALSVCSSLAKRFWSHHFPATLLNFSPQGASLQTAGDIISKMS